MTAPTSVSVDPAKVLEVFWFIPYKMTEDSRHLRDRHVPDTRDAHPSSGLPKIKAGHGTAPPIVH